MSRLVMKFGGTSVAGLDRMRVAASRVAREVSAGKSVAVVVSAMAGETDRLLGLAREAGADVADPRDETDAILATGEQVSAAMMALLLRAEGVKARSWQGWQAPVRASASHGKARIDGLTDDLIGPAIDSGEVAVLTGFQGVTENNRIATLGRGGSDVSAVGLAAALGGAQCDIYTDVDGVYSADPRIVRRARRLDRISYEEMLEFASLGAKVLQTRSVELAMARNVPLRVVSSMMPLEADNPGTLVCAEDENMEQRIVSGVAYTRDEAKVSLLGLPPSPQATACIFDRLADADVNVDMIVQSPARSGQAANMVFTVGMAELDRALEAISAHKDEIGYSELASEANVSKVSVIGLGMRSHSGVAQTMFSALNERGIAAQAISTSEIKISVLIDAEYTELAVRALHAAFGLDAE